MDTISFAGDGFAPELLPSEELADCAATALEEDGARILSYGTGAGYTPLRELVAEVYGVHPQRVLLTNGWLQGFMLLARDRARGRNVLVEYPTYDKVRRMLFSVGANLVYLDLHPDGFAIDNLIYQVRVNANLAFAYTIPTFHNPTGQSLTLEQREAMVSTLGRSETLLIEDDTYSLLRYEGERLPTLFELSRQTSVYSTSFSQTLAPGLRVGVFILPGELSAQLAAAANSTYITPALIGQATVFEFIRRGSFEPHLERLTGELTIRRDAMLSALDQHFAGATWSRPEGGIFVQLQLAPGTDAAKVIERAEGVTALAGEDYGGYPNSIRLNFAAPALDEIETGIERLAAAVESPPEA